MGLGQWEALTICSLKYCGIRSHAVDCLAQLQSPLLAGLGLTGNRFESKAIASLSGASWPALTEVSLGFQDLDEHDCDVLGICNLHGINLTMSTMDIFTPCPQEIVLSCPV